MHYLFLGDSITCCDRLWDNTHHGLGDGFVYHLYHVLLSDDPDLIIANKGFNGLTASGLLERIRDHRIDITGYDVIVLLIGINDIGVSQNTGKTLADQSFYDTIKELLCILKKTTSHIICLSPFLFFYPAEYLTWKAELHYALSCISASCKETDTIYLCLQDYFAQLTSMTSANPYSDDGIHLTQTGHRHLAEYLYPVLTTML